MYTMKASMWSVHIKGLWSSILERISVQTMQSVSVTGKPQALSTRILTME